MATKEAAEQACKEPNPIIDGRKANVNLAILGAKPRGNAIQGKLTYTWIDRPEKADRRMANRALIIDALEKQKERKKMAAEQK